MTTIISGRFQQQEQADTTMSDLLRSGIPSSQMTSFFVSPRGQPGDWQSGSEHAGVGAVYGAAAGAAAGCLLALVALPTLGLAAALLGAALGAYVGSLPGALSQMNDGPIDGNPDSGIDDASSVSSGLLVAVSPLSLLQRATAIRILGSRRAAGIGQSDGRFSAGQWDDFNRSTQIAALA